VKRHRRIAEVVILSLALAAPTLAGGPTQKPDGVGNPSGLDYTGWFSLYLIIGVRESTTQATTIHCYNPTSTTAAVAVQAWDASPVVGRNPQADARIVNSFSRSRYLRTQSTVWFGTPTGVEVVKIIGVNENGRGKPSLICSAEIREKATNDTIATLPVIPYRKQPKPRDLK